MGQKLGERWSQQIVVENRPGGNTVIASQAVAHAAPDGYTLLLVNSSFAVNAALATKLPYDTEKDFAPVCAIGAAPFMLIANASVPARDFKEMSALLKASKPGEWNFATAGSNGVGRVATELFAQEMGIQVQHIPF